MAHPSKALVVYSGGFQTVYFISIQISEVECTLLQRIVSTDNKLASDHKKCIF